MDDEGLEALGVSASIVIFLHFIIPFSTVSFNAIGSVLVERADTVTTFLVRVPNTDPASAVTDPALTLAVDPASTDMEPVLTLTDQGLTLTDAA